MAQRYELSMDDEDVYVRAGFSVQVEEVQPVSLTYNVGDDTDALIARLSSYENVLLGAPTNSGKSCRIPRLLAKKVSGLVVYVVANPVLAASVYDFVANDFRYSADGVTSMLYAESRLVPSGLNKPTVLYIGANELVAWLLSSPNYALHGAIIYMDEAHEMDAYTATITSLARSLGAQRLIRVSATFIPVDPIAEEFQRIINSGKYPSDDTPQTWDLSDVEQPWYCSPGESQMIYTDSPVSRTVLADKCARLGAEVDYITSKTTVSQYRDVVKTLAKKPDKPVVILADSSYRSGFKFNVDKIVDTGFVRDIDEDGKSMATVYRPLTDLEASVTSTRFSRSGRNYYRPDSPCFPPKVGLSRTDKEASTLLSMCLGFTSLRGAANMVMSEFNVNKPFNLVQAMNSEIPLHLQWELLVSSPGLDSRLGIVDTRLLDNWRVSLTAEPPPLVGMARGDYIACPSVAFVLSSDNLTSPLFRAGMVSVVHELDTSTYHDAMFLRLTGQDRNVFIACVVKRYNSVTLDLRALLEVLQEAIQTFGRRVRRDVLVSVQTEYRQRVSDLQAVQRKLFIVIESMFRSGVSMRKIDCPVSAFSTRKAHYLEEILRRSQQIADSVIVNDSGWFGELTIDPAVPEPNHAVRAARAAGRPDDYYLPEELTQAQCDERRTEFGVLTYSRASGIWTGVGPSWPQPDYVGTPWKYPVNHPIRVLAARLYPEEVPR